MPNVFLQSYVNSVLANPKVGLEVFATDSDANMIFQGLLANQAYVTVSTGFFYFQTDGHSLNFLISLWGDGLEHKFQNVGYPNDIFTIQWMASKRMFYITYIITSARILVWNWIEITTPANFVQGQVLPGGPAFIGTVDGGNFQDRLVDAPGIDGGSFTTEVFTSVIDGGVD